MSNFQLRRHALILFAYADFTTFSNSSRMLRKYLQNTPGRQKKPHICTNYINSQKHVETDVDGKFCVYIFGIFNSLLRQAVVKISPGLFSGEVFYVILFMNFLHAFDREKRI